jgi:hypothetical protein
MKLSKEFFNKKINLMKKSYFIIVLGMLLAMPFSHSQSVKFIFEDFDGAAVDFDSEPLNWWKVDTNYYATHPNGYLGKVPNMEGDSIILTSKVHNLEDYGYIYFWFNNICKVSPRDVCRVEYKVKSADWKVIPGSAYLGTSNYLLLNGFNAGSYAEWNGTDSLASPNNSWWKQEIFDMSGVMANDEEAQFRFILKRGTTPATNISYGWLLDAVKIIGSTYPIDCMTADCFNPNSVALSSIDNPVEGTVDGGVSTPIVVTIHNTGTINLDSAMIYWTINGQNLSFKKWMGNLAWGTAAKDTVGYFTPTADAYDTIKVWLALPNGQVDPTTTDDTLDVSFFGCGQRMEGPQYIGDGKAFSSINELLEILKTCNPSGDMTFVLDSGLYEATSIDLRNLSTIFGDYSLTITSATGKAEDVIIRPEPAPNTWTPSVPALYLGNTHNVTIKNITLDGTSTGYHTVEFLDSCHNIVFYGCSILNSRTVTSNYSSISKVAGTGVVDSIFFIKNTIDGGFRGINFIGAGTSTAYATNILCDSNQLINQHLHAVYFDYSDLISCSHNTMTSRAGASNSFWNGIYMGNANGPIIGNYIKSYPSTGYPAGIFTAGYHNNTSTKGLIANNEIMINSTNTFYGAIHVDNNTKADIIHNSVHVGGTTGSGIRINNISNHQLTVKNNNVVMEASSAYPFYLSASTTGTQVDIDYNNIYAPLYISFAGAAISDWIAWRGAVPTDLNSKSIYPDFKKIQQDLSVSNYSDYLCNVISTVNTDIKGNPRTGVTTMSCYEDIPLVTTNGVLMELVGFDNDPAIGQVDSLRAVVFNGGNTSITSINIEWSVDGTPHLAGGEDFDISPLSKGQSDTVFIGKMTHTPGVTNVKLWINSLNNGSNIDEILVDDTLKVSNYVCDLPFSGTLIVADTTDYYSIGRALELIAQCGVSGDVTLALDSGLYPETVNLSGVSEFLDGYTLTITSRSGKAKDVIIRPATAAGIILNKSNKIIIKDITIDVRNSLTTAIYFSGPCTNVIIRDCELYSTTTATSGTYYVIHKEYSSVATNNLDSVFIINNLIDGGSVGVHFSAGGGTTAYAKNIVFDSNMVSNQYQYALSTSYTIFSSISYNTFLTRDTLSSNSWNGIRIDRAGGHIIGNRIIQRSDKITSPIGIYLYAFNTDETRLIANNEIMLSMSAAGCGIHLSGGNGSTVYTRTDVVHNSIYIKCSATNPRGIYVPNFAYIYASIKNNNIVMDGMSAYPFYFETPSFLSQLDINSNNYYNSTNLGYLAGFGDITTWEDWRSFITTDVLSVQTYPDFSDVDASLDLTDASGLVCRLSDAVSLDINKQQRQGLTALGCYDAVLNYTENAMLSQILPLKQGMAPATKDTIKVVVVNTGSSPITNINFSYSDGNTIITPATKNVSIPAGALDTVEVAEITYPSNSFELKLWINSLNVTDGFKADDTISTYIYVCATPLSGDYEVGEGKYFANFEQAFSNITYCGVSGDVNLLLPTGTYSGFSFYDYGAQVAPYMLTITSKARDKDSVVIEASPTGIKLNLVRNFRFEHLTIDATAGAANTYGIQFAGACTNIVINNCSILMDTTSANATNIRGIQKESGSILDSIFITNNYINGGQFGIYMQAGASSNTTLASMGKNLFVENNTIINSCSTAMYALRAMFGNISGNTIISRSANTLTSWTGFNILISTADNVTNNRIIQRSTNITNPTGMGITGLNQYNVFHKALVANNEVIIYTTGAYQALNIGGNSKADVLHNSVYVSGTGAARGIYVNDNAGNFMTIKNNNVVMESDDAFPISLSAITYLYSNYEIDYNNMYAPTYVGFAAGNKETIKDWQEIVNIDKNSVSVQPHFFNPSLSLEMSDFSGLTCPYDSLVPTDIKGLDRKNRINTTIMGAYTSFEAALDLAVTHIICDETEIQYPNTVPVEIGITNLGYSTNVNNAVFGWSVNGVLQPSFQWNPATALAPQTDLEIPIGSFEAGRSNGFDIMVWVESVNGTKDSIAWNDTADLFVNILITGTNLSIHALEPLTPTGSLCAEDYAPIEVIVINTGTLDYDFAANPVSFGVRNTTPVKFESDTVISSGVVLSGDTVYFQLTDEFPIVTAGQYDINVFLSSTIDNINHDDTLLTHYFADRFGLPLDEDFSNPTLASILRSRGVNSSYKWEIVSQGAGADSVVKPEQGTGMLAFSGTMGAMTRLSTGQLDLSQTIQPALSFWYFHDTVPCEDYTDVRITVDGGETYSKLYSLTKYDAVYGWRQYSADLPSFAINQCVILVFEAMEKSESGDVAQYIDRIRVTAKQDIEVAGVLTSGFSVCNMQNQDWKVVLTNNAYPDLVYDNTPTEVVLEILGTSHRFTKLLQTGSLSGFSSDTITLTPDFDFLPGTYNVKAYFTSVLDENPSNDTLRTSILINPEFTIEVHNLSEDQDGKRATAGIEHEQKITITNTGNMELSDFSFVLTLDTNGIEYFTTTMTVNESLAPGESRNFTFDTAYIVPYYSQYAVTVYGYLLCNTTIDTIASVPEKVNMKDVAVVEITSPAAGTIDETGSEIIVSVKIKNRDLGSSYIAGEIKAGIMITGTNGNVIATNPMEELPAIGSGEEILFTFTGKYTVPDSSKYHLVVYIGSEDDYAGNDTVKMVRTTDKVGIFERVGVSFTMEQNIPNPAQDKTIINYNVPQDGEITFAVYSVNGQLLYNKKETAFSGDNQIELNLSDYAAGIYFYTMEYKGQRIVKKMSVRR